MRQHKQSVSLLRFKPTCVNVSVKPVQPQISGSKSVQTHARHKVDQSGSKQCKAHASQYKVRSKWFKFIAKRAGQYKVSAKSDQSGSKSVTKHIQASTKSDQSGSKSVQSACKPVQSQIKVDQSQCKAYASQCKVRSK